MSAAEHVLEIGLRLVGALARGLARLLGLIGAAGSRGRAMPATPPVDPGNPDDGFEQVAFLRRQMQQTRSSWPQPPSPGRW